MRFKDTIGISHTFNLIEQEQTYQMDAILRGFKLTSAQYTALSMLESFGAMTNAELARSCHVTPQTMIRITKALQEAGLIKKAKAETGQGLALTAMAKNLICDAHIAVNDLEKQMLKTMDKADSIQLQKALEVVLNNLRSLSPENRDAPAKE